MGQAISSLVGMANTAMNFASNVISEENRQEKRRLEQEFDNLKTPRVAPFFFPTKGLRDLVIKDPEHPYSSQQMQKTLDLGKMPEGYSRVQLSGFDFQKYDETQNNKWIKDQKPFADYLDSVLVFINERVPESEKPEFQKQSLEYLGVTPEEFIERFRTERADPRWFKALGSIFDSLQKDIVASEKFKQTVEKTNQTVADVAEKRDEMLRNLMANSLIGQFNNTNLKNNFVLG